MSQVCGPVCPGIGRTMMCILLFSGLCSCLHRYHLIDELMNWTKAREYCREKHTDLAKIDNTEDMKRVVEAAGRGYVGNVWIGLRYRPGSWEWSLSDPSFYKEGEWEFTNWNQGEPNDRRGHGKLCVAMRNGYWHDYQCHHPKMFVCYQRNLQNGILGSGNIPIPNYFLIQEMKTWDEAQAYCRKYYTDLASVRNFNENALIKSTIGDPNASVSLGLYIEDWSWWSDGTNSTFKNWADDFPKSATENCVASLIKPPYFGKWKEGPCYKNRNFMCLDDRKRKHVIHFKLTALTSTIDLNDPAVTEAISNLIREKMEEKGFPTDVKTSWVKKTDNTIFHKEEEKNKD